MPPKCPTIQAKQTSSVFVRREKQYGGEEKSACSRDDSRLLPGHSPGIDGSMGARQNPPEKDRVHNRRHEYGRVKTVEHAAVAGKEI